MPGRFPVLVPLHRRFEEDSQKGCEFKPRARFGRLAAEEKSRVKAAAKIALVSNSAGIRRSTPPLVPTTRRGTFISGIIRVLLKRPTTTREMRRDPFSLSPPSPPMKDSLDCVYLDIHAPDATTTNRATSPALLPAHPITAPCSPPCHPHRRPRLEQPQQHGGPPPSPRRRRSRTPASPLPRGTSYTPASTAARRQAK